MPASDQSLIEQQIAFYRGLVAENPDVYGELEADSDLVRFALSDCDAVSSCLELGSGTGRWTRHLLRLARQVTAVDSSPEAHFLSMQRLQSERVSYKLADIFLYDDDAVYDLVGFWLSHVPESRFNAFWALVSKLLAPCGRAVFVDSQESGPGGGGSSRRLSDGQEYEIVKVSHDLDHLAERLGALGWRATVEAMSSNIYRVAAWLA
jgi:SAM-dependent methyltransferase